MLDLLEFEYADETLDEWANLETDDFHIDRLPSRILKSQSVELPTFYNTTGRLANQRTTGFGRLLGLCLSETAPISNASTRPAAAIVSLR